MLMKLIRKEFRLAMHPTNLIFLALSAMLIIPNYPYYVTFFYTSLGVFFVCLTGRENHDIEYSMSLPVRKRDLVRARIGFVVALQCLQVVAAIPFAVLRQSMQPVGNDVGMDANIAFFGLAFGMMALFNLLFFTRYYKAPDKVGSAFVISSIATFLYMGVAEALTHIVPFFRDQLDTPDTEHLPVKLCVLAAGVVVYAAATLLACRVSEKRFEALDL